MLIYCSLLFFVATVAVVVELAVGYRKVRPLDFFKPIENSEDLPLVSLIIPARNEEAAIDSALRSLCRQEYPNLEIIVVNDRSTDGTGDAVEAVMADFPRIKLINIKDLPEGWLGKPHALHCGADAARGEYLVFSDADVQMEPTTISRAVTVMTEKGVDHLALTFQNISGGALLNALIIEAGAGLIYLLKPWRVSNDRSRFFVGVGAFNMVRRTAYYAVGGHECMKMQVIDDLYLGRQMKYGGFRQLCLLGDGFITLPWYGSVAEMVNGLMKNTFALFQYRLSLAMAALVSLGVLFGFPLYGVLFGAGAARYIFAASIGLRVVVIGLAMVRLGHSAVSPLCLVVTPFISMFIILKSALTVTLRQEIVWREHSYPLKRLREETWVLSGLFTVNPNR